MTSLSCQFNALRTLNSLYETLRTFVRLTRKMSDRKSGVAGKASDIHEASRGTTVPPPAMPPFNTATSVLGTRCAHGHTHGRTGQSLRNTHSGECGRCVAARQVKRCQGKRTSPGRFGLHTAEGL